MKFLLDENVDRRLIPFLKQLGHDIKVIAQDYAHSLLDQEVLAISVQEQRILITQDTSDFGELIFRHHYPHCGIILLRFKSECRIQERSGSVSLYVKRFKVIK